MLNISLIVYNSCEKFSQSNMPVQRTVSFFFKDFLSKFAQYKLSVIKKATVRISVELIICFEVFSKLKQKLNKTYQTKLHSI